MTETPRPDHAMSDQTPTDPWNDIYEGIAFNYEDDKLITAIELARAAEREQHQREIAQRDETIRQLRARERELESAVDSAQALARAFAASEARCATLTTALTEAQQQRDPPANPTPQGPLTCESCGASDVYRCGCYDRCRCDHDRRSHTPHGICTHVGCACTGA